MDDSQKADLLSFVRDDGKGFIGIHSAAITFISWPEYGKMIGGYFDGHPWGEFDAPLVVEDAGFPGMEHFPASFTLKDEIYQIKDFSRDNVRVLLRLDAEQGRPVQEGRPPQGQGFRGHLGPRLRQGPRPLQRPGASAARSGTARDPEDVAGDGAVVDGDHPRRCHAEAGLLAPGVGPSLPASLLERARTEPRPPGRIRRVTSSRHAQRGSGASSPPRRTGSPSGDRWARAPRGSGPARGRRGS